MLNSFVMLITIFSTTTTSKLLENIEKKIAKLYWFLFHAYVGGKNQNNFLTFKIENSKETMKNIGDYSSISENRLKLVFRKILFEAYLTFKRRLLTGKNV